MGWNYTEENLGFYNLKWSIWATWFTHEVWESKRPRWIWFPRFIDQLMLVGWDIFRVGKLLLVDYQKVEKQKPKYNSYEGEFLTIVWVMVTFLCYLFSSPFALVTIPNHWSGSWSLINSLGSWQNGLSFFRNMILMSNMEVE